MVAAGLVDETGGPQNGDMQYTYKLKPDTRALLDQTPNEPMQRFRELGTRLIAESIWPLELGSTILFFYRLANDWDLALTRACEFKKVPGGAEINAVALGLAQGVHAQANQ